MESDWPKIRSGRGISYMQSDQYICCLSNSYVKFTLLQMKREYPDTANYVYTDNQYNDKIR